VLQKPLLVVEFGKSRRDPGYGSDARRDAVFGTVYAKVYQSARAAGLPAGALFCQLLAVGMDSYGDGYEVVLGRAPSSTAGVIARRPGHVGGVDAAMMRRGCGGAVEAEEDVVGDGGPGGVLGVAV
jgi:mannan endo-1,4-beta-mannosidase